MGITTICTALMLLGLCMAGVAVWTQWGWRIPAAVFGGLMAAAVKYIERLVQ